MHRLIVDVSAEERYRTILNVNQEMKSRALSNEYRSRRKEFEEGRRLLSK